jgi:hypothetical protein
VYKSNLIKESIRMGHVQLGDFYYARGDLQVGGWVKGKGGGGGGLRNPAMVVYGRTHAWWQHDGYLQTGCGLLSSQPEPMEEGSLPRYMRSMCGA